MASGRRLSMPTCVEGGGAGRKEGEGAIVSEEVRRIREELESKQKSRLRHVQGATCTTQDKKMQMVRAKMKERQLAHSAARKEALREEAKKYAEWANTVGKVKVDNRLQPPQSPESPPTRTPNSASPEALGGGSPPAGALPDLQQRRVLERGFSQLAPLNIPGGRARVGRRRASVDMCEGIAGELEAIRQMHAHGSSLRESPGDSASSSGSKLRRLEKFIEERNVLEARFFRDREVAKTAHDRLLHDKRTWQVDGMIQHTGEDGVTGSLQFFVDRMVSAPPATLSGDGGLAVSSALVSNILRPASSAYDFAHLPSMPSPSERDLKKPAHCRGRRSSIGPGVVVGSVSLSAVGLNEVAHKGKLHDLVKGLPSPRHGHHFGVSRTSSAASAAASQGL